MSNHAGRPRLPDQKHARTKVTRAAPKCSRDPVLPINFLTEHFKEHKKDNHSRRGLLKIGVAAETTARTISSREMRADTRPSSRSWT